MATDLMRYDRLVQGALRGVVVAALRRVAREGLAGDHHFYISFRADHPGARVPADLKARFPEETTIVLQNQFWDLEVDESQFAVSLNFDGVPQRLVVPFESVTSFADPSVEFVLKFEPPGKAAAPAREGGPKPAAQGAGEVVVLDAFRKN